ncbi:phage/plasmid primase, P4 family [Alisedimentitalea sp. MJ-SS2]|uniref:phage/plasmid primase, P4 family n=1 Tax=Aliisedimentitalea sp. MJ-SS2 TaxID=3049795 RepID=UPI002913E4C9|nr:phage/plasmid primase, P4 family [Alisedimentitalea sp. MJ-SS2]MDU8929677.1 phage/plasmid primase, P4 family [Alisedimentitalea sp. MJ-SS2]
MTYPNRPQYILHRDKVPCDSTGQNIDPHNPAQWMTHDQAQAEAARCGLEVGFVLTAADPFFVVDLDKCRDASGAYDERAHHWHRVLAGAGVELSRSGTGLHFWGCCDQAIAKEYMNRADGYEFYTSGRFIALGTDMRGDPGRDYTEALRGALTPRPVEAGAGVPGDGPVPEYTGPTDDAELIRMMLQSRPGPAAAFGSKATLKQLWTGDVEALSRVFPAYSDDDFDRSSADAALCSHLAFWTGKDVARIEQLWLQSPLAASRPDKKKLQRKDYVSRTIESAAEKVGAVYTGATETNVDDATSRRLVAWRTHHDMALAYANENRGNLFYNDDKNVWLRFEGTHWCEQKKGAVIHDIRFFCDRNSLPEAKSPRSTNFIKNVETLVQADTDFSRKSDDFDRDNYLLNTPDGTVDLRTGIVRPHKAEDMISKLTVVGPRHMENTRWSSFVDEVFCGDADLIETAQAMLGACLSGAIEEHWFCFAYGTGRNGKSVLFDLIKRILGDYAKVAPSSLIAQKKHSDHREGIARLQGARLVIASEVEANSHFAEALLKEITGNETLTARFMHGPTFEFKRTFKFCVVGNHKPKSRNADRAFTRRLKILPFRADFASTADPNLPEMLKNEAPAVLQWLIDGHRKWLENGKSVPTCSAVEAELDDWKETQLTPENWISECLKKASDDGRSNVNWPKSSELYNNYKVWAHQNSVHAMPSDRWREHMERAGFERVKSDGVRYKYVEISDPAPDSFTVLPGGRSLPG